MTFVLAFIVLCANGLVLGAWSGLCIDNVVSGTTRATACELQTGWSVLALIGVPPVVVVAIGLKWPNALHVATVALLVMSGLLFALLAAVASG